ncbi:hypothetical protein Tco_1113731 [Tanacetum coccineum]|uniref:Reverse transcriptase domain-containing protein n=1 Tax=Tanacetum coccineum TaxID=301880 RepID=A0ABQ5IW08_9ASTR
MKNGWILMRNATSKRSKYSFYPRQEHVEPLEWKAPETRPKPSISEPLKLELQELPEHLEYAFLQGDDQLPMVISSTLSIHEKAKLFEILMENEYKPTVHPQRRVNPNIKKVVKKEVIKLLDAGLIYPISDMWD